MAEREKLAEPESGYPWGDDDPKGRVCWSAEHNRDGTCAVGSYPIGAGRWGMLDLAGNVWEWTSTERRGKRVFMGGAWNDGSPRRMRYGSENRNDVHAHFDDVGFRCVRNAK